MPILLFYIQLITITGFITTRVRLVLKVPQGSSSLGSHRPPPSMPPPPPQSWARCSSVQYSTVQYSTVYSTVQYSTVQYSTWARCSSARPRSPSRLCHPRSWIVVSKVRNEGPRSLKFHNLGEGPY